MHAAGAQQLFVPRRPGSRKERRGSRAPSKKSQFPTPEYSPAPWLLPKPRPSSALGNKYLYGDNYSIWEENPIKQEPCRAANAGTELEAATPPNGRLLPIMQELPVPRHPSPGPKRARPPLLAASGGLGHRQPPPGPEQGFRVYCSTPACLVRDKDSHARIQCRVVSSSHCVPAALCHLKKEQ